MFQRCISHTWLQSKKDTAFVLFDFISLSWKMDDELIVIQRDFTGEHIPR